MLHFYEKNKTELNYYCCAIHLYQWKVSLSLLSTAIHRWSVNLFVWKGSSITKVFASNKLKISLTAHHHQHCPSQRPTPSLFIEIFLPFFSFIFTCKWKPQRNRQNSEFRRQSSYHMNSFKHLIIWHGNSLKWMKSNVFLKQQFQLEIALHRKAKTKIYNHPRNNNRWTTRHLF